MMYPEENNDTLTHHHDVTTYPHHGGKYHDSTPFPNAMTSKKIFKATVSKTGAIKQYSLSSIHSNHEAQTSNGNPTSIWPIKLKRMQHNKIPSIMVSSKRSSKYTVSNNNSKPEKSKSTKKPSRDKSHHRYPDNMYNMTGAYPVRKHSTYYNIALNTSPNELTVMSMNVSNFEGYVTSNNNKKAVITEGSVLADEKSIESIIVFIKQLQEEYNPDILLLQGADSVQNQKALEKLSMHEPLFPYQTQNCINSINRNRSANKKSNKTANDWDSISGSFSCCHSFHKGILILSKWPLRQRHALVFGQNSLHQCCRNEGAVYVQIEKCGRIYNIISFQLNDGKSRNALRLRQIKDIMNWLRSGMEDTECIEFSIKEEEDDSAMSEKIKKMNTFDTKAEDVCEDDETIASSSSSSTFKSSLSSTPDEKNKTMGQKDQKGSNSTLNTKACKKNALPSGIIKVSDPLIFGGDMSFRLKEDYTTLLEVLRCKYMNASLALDERQAKAVEGSTSNSTPHNLTYLLLSNEHGGSISLCPTIEPRKLECTVKAWNFVCECIPCGKVDKPHVIECTPVCATFTHDKY